MKVQAARKIQVARILNLPHLFSQFKHQLLSLTTCQCCGQGTYIFSKIPPTNTKSIKHMMPARKIQASRNPPHLLPQLQHQRSKYHQELQKNQTCKNILPVKYRQQGTCFTFSHGFNISLLLVQRYLQVWSTVVKIHTSLAVRYIKYHTKNITDILTICSQDPSSAFSRTPTK